MTLLSRYGSSNPEPDIALLLEVLGITRKVVAWKTKFKHNEPTSLPPGLR